MSNQELNYSAVASAQFLKGILKVLTDMHVRDMNESRRTDYIQALAKDMEEFKKAISNGINN